ncbi:helix-turn-helix domain-containing protein [Sphingobacterium suaedae]|uniref:Helix-turn-helix domain-containing protein n=1 Tax=Sphingobacterium suaedae TaxID=1686402 RepID=A0ABW5KMG9_9SPHI
MESISSHFKLKKLEGQRESELCGQLSTAPDFFTIIKTAGTTTLKINNDKYQVAGNTLVFISPGKNVRFSYTGLGGFMLTFSASFYEQSSKDTVILNSELFFGSEKSFETCTISENEELMQQKWLEKLNWYRIAPPELYEAAMHNFVESLLLFGLQTKNKFGQTTMLNTIPGVGTVNTFTVMIHKNYRKEQNVAFYADRLNICPRKLSQLCTRVVGKTARELIRDVIVKEALRYIRNTDMSISEIAYSMGFTEESNFRHFVKKHTGKTPSTFRIYQT